jgi:hypothetical protein
MESLNIATAAAIQSWPDLPNRTAPSLTMDDTALQTTRPAAGEIAPQAIEARCPQGRDCSAGGAESRIFECQEGCGFRGCKACMEIHESEPHTSDSMISLEMARNGGGGW